MDGEAPTARGPNLKLAQLQAAISEHESSLRGHAEGILLALVSPLPEVDKMCE